MEEMRLRPRGHLIPPAIIALALLASLGPHLLMLGHHVAGAAPPSELLLFCPLHHITSAHPGGLIEMHFSFFVVIVVLTLYKDWLVFLLAVGLVLIHHGIMGTVDPRAVSAIPVNGRTRGRGRSFHALLSPGCRRVGLHASPHRHRRTDPGRGTLDEGGGHDRARDPAFVLPEDMAGSPLRALPA